MAGTWVRVGTVTVTSGSKKVTGAGTSWLSNLLQKVGKGCMCVIDNVISEVDYVNSDTELYLVEAWEGATASGKKYKIQVTVTDTIPELSSRISQSLAYANSQYGNLESWATGAAANVTLTGPAGNQVTLPNLAAMNSGPGSSPDFDLRSPAQLLRWQNYGTGHTIFDASKGKSPANVDINNANPSIPWASTFPTLMGWNGETTYGVRVDSARSSDVLNNSLVSASGQDLLIRSGRAIVGFPRDATEFNRLAINYEGDWEWVQVWGDRLEASRVVSVRNGSTSFQDGQYEARSTDGSAVRIGLHRSGHTAAAIMHNEWGIYFERENPGNLSQVAAKAFYDESGHAAAHEYNGTYQPLLRVENTGDMLASDNVGYWVRSGVQAFVHGVALIKDTTPFNETLLITLPFIVSGAHEYYPTGSLAIYNATLLNGIRYIWMATVKGTSTAYLYCIDGTGVSRMIKANDISSGGYGHFRFSISFGV